MPRGLKTFADAFAGVGGFRLGLEALGLRCRATIEIDRHARLTYKANFKCDHPIREDIYGVQGKDLPKFDVLTGGFPCQPFSQGGLRKGTEDSRGVLFLEIVRLARECRPKVVISENVKGILGRKFEDMRRAFIHMLDELGYTTQHDIYTACDFGVPQLRERVFFVSVLRGSGIRWRPLLIDDPRPCKVADVLQRENAVDDRYYLADDMAAKLVRYDTPPRDGRKILKQLGYIDKSGIRKGAKFVSRGGYNGTGWCGNRVYETSGLGACLYASGSGGVASQTNLYMVNGRMRRLTPREAFSLMGFPQSFVIPAKDDQAYKQAGNAVVPQVVKAVAGSLTAEGAA